MLIPNSDIASCMKKDHIHRSGGGMHGICGGVIQAAEKTCPFV